MSLFPQMEDRGARAGGSECVHEARVRGRTIHAGEFFAWYFVSFFACHAVLVSYLSYKHFPSYPDFCREKQRLKYSHTSFRKQNLS